MDVLVSLGSICALGYSLYGLYNILISLENGDSEHAMHLSHNLYFDSTGMILTLVSVGKFLESRSKGKTKDAINSLLDIVPKKIIRIKTNADGSETEENISASEVRRGDIILISKGEAASVDGIVVLGEASFDESAITGESEAVKKNEGDEVEAIFGPKGNYDLNFVRVNAQERFYKKLEGVIEPEKKRKIIGEEFIRVFEEESKKIGKVDFLAQGTIYPDVIESGLGKSAVIKSHHNVGGLPDYVDFREIIEPLRMLFKDEVRKAGLELGLPEELVFRQPFPGPGLGVRIIGEVNEEKVRIVQDADYIFREEIRIAVKRRKEELLAEAKEFEAKGDTAKADSLKKQAKENPTWLPNQYFAALSNMRSVGVMGDFRTYDYAVVLRAVNTSDFMTAECTNIPFEILQKAMNRIINEVKGVNRVMYDLTSKPPGTIELE